MLASVGHGIPHVFTPHGTLNGDEHAGWSGLLMRRIVARVLSRTDLLVAVSEGAARITSGSFRDSIADDRASSSSTMA